MIALSIIEPQTEEHWQHYYQLRWKLLREPWQQVEGTEKDELENTACHRMVVLKTKLPEWGVCIALIS